MRQRRFTIGNSNVTLKEHDNGALSIEGNFGENNQNVSYSYENDNSGSHITKVKEHLDNAYSGSMDQLSQSYDEAKNFLNS